MDAVCKICGKGMMKAKGYTIQKLRMNDKIYECIKIGVLGDFDEDRPEMPRAKISMHSSDICTIGAAMQNDARHVAVSQSAADAKKFTSKDELIDSFKGVFVQR